MNSNEIETQIDSLLAAHSVTLTSHLVGERTTDNWTHDLWACTLSRAGRAYHFDYRTGTGHRRTVKGRTMAQKPVAASVLYSLCSDAQCGEYTFLEFCANLGYDEDNRKALATYLECQAIAVALRGVLGAHLLAQIEELVQEY